MAVHIHIHTRNRDGARLIAIEQASTPGGQRAQAKVYYDPDTEEYTCKLFIGNPWRYVASADYFTDDKNDALGTAKRMANDWRGIAK